jgi:hypothetical protein
MKSLHRALLGVALIALLAISLGFAQPWMSVAEAQHGHGAGAEEQFDAFATHLELTDVQREALAAPFREGFAALQNIHRLHGLIVAELTDEQADQFAEMVHEMVGASFAGEGHETEGHGGLHH